ncbi:hypothetical protein FWK35_00018718 [Aphis craccivora]|uniref:Uncharacterized protein n=1 Tax=Aphis craccivora TaxID=307492 RepID=A0A6G0YJ81_APHCR|nr:hypothetical protein FWK35_00018718 [Aphis craccivora]
MNELQRSSLKRYANYDLYTLSTSQKKHLPNLPTTIELAIKRGTCKINLEAISKTEHVFGDETLTYAAKNKLLFTTKYN